MSSFPHRLYGVGLASLLLAVTGCQMPSWGTAVLGQWATSSVTDSAETEPHQDRPETATAAAEEESPIDPVARKSNVMLARAQLLEADGDFEQARALYTSILTEDPDNSRALHRSAVLHARDGELVHAERAFQDALQADPDDAKIHGDYGYFCYLQRRWDLAEGHLQQAVHLDSKIPQAHLNLGMLCARQGLHEKAELHFRNAGCDDASSQTNMALARLLESDFDGAQTAYQHALQQDPGNEDAVQGIGLLERVAHRNGTVSAP
jgi:Tfp pilus assembly protein PilF